MKSWIRILAFGVSAVALIWTQSYAQGADPDLIEAAKVCESQRAIRPMEVTPGSFFKDGWQHCLAVIEECRKTRPHCLDQARIDEEAARKKKVDDLVKKLVK